MQCAFGRAAAREQLLDLVFEKKLFSLQFENVEIIRRRKMLFRFNLSFKRFMSALEFRKMAMHRHLTIPFEKADDPGSLHETERLRKRKNSLWLVKNP